MTTFCEDKIFKECMADAASTIVKRYKGKMPDRACRNIGVNGRKNDTTVLSERTITTIMKVFMEISGK